MRSVFLRTSWNRPRMTQIQRIFLPLPTSKNSKETKNPFVLLVFFDVSALSGRNNSNLSRIKQIFFPYLLDFVSICSMSRVSDFSRYTRGGGPVSSTGRHVKWRHRLPRSRAPALASLCAFLILHSIICTGDVHIASTIIGATFCASTLKNFVPLRPHF